MKVRKVLGAEPGGIKQCLFNEKDFKKLEGEYYSPDHIA